MKRLKLIGAIVVFGCVVLFRARIGLTGESLVLLVTFSLLLFAAANEPSCDDGSLRTSRGYLLQAACDEWRTHHPCIVDLDSEACQEWLADHCDECGRVCGPNKSW